MIGKKDVFLTERIKVTAPNNTETAINILNDLSNIGNTLRGIHFVSYEDLKSFESSIGS